MSEEIQESQVEESPAVEEVSESQVEAAPESAGEQSVAQEPSAPATAWDAFKGLDEFAGKDDRAIATSLYSALQAKQESQKGYRAVSANAAVRSGVPRKQAGF